MSDYHSNTVTWDRVNAVDPQQVRCPECGGKGSRHDERCSK